MLSGGKLRWPLTTKRHAEIEVAVARMTGFSEGRASGYASGLEDGKIALALEVQTIIRGKWDGV